MCVSKVCITFALQKNKMNKGRSIKREQLPNKIIKLIKKDRKNFSSDNAHRIALDINPRTYKAIKADKECRSDVLDKIKIHLGI